ncbi:hypothetical protein SNEBB_007792 [Seison nebaliae]|nr:hypothetical protein SNEBB_007792 [Seison nebaliae]
MGATKGEWDEELQCPCSGRYQLNLFNDTNSSIHDKVYDSVYTTQLSEKNVSLYMILSGEHNDFAREHMARSLSFELYDYFNTMNFDNNRQSVIPDEEDDDDDFEDYFIVEKKTVKNGAISKSLIEKIINIEQHYFETDLDRMIKEYKNALHRYSTNRFHMQSFMRSASSSTTSLINAIGIHSSGRHSKKNSKNRIPVSSQMLLDNYNLSDDHKTKSLSPSTLNYNELKKCIDLLKSNISLIFTLVNDNDHIISGVIGRGRVLVALFPYHRLKSSSIPTSCSFSFKERSIRPHIAYYIPLNKEHTLNNPTEIKRWQLLRKNVSKLPITTVTRCLGSYIDKHYYQYEYNDYQSTTTFPSSPLISDASINFYPFKINKTDNEHDSFFLTVASSGVFYALQLLGFVSDEQANEELCRQIAQRLIDKKMLYKFLLQLKQNDQNLYEAFRLNMILNDVCQAVLTDIDAKCLEKKLQIQNHIQLIKEQLQFAKMAKTNSVSSNPEENLMEEEEHDLTEQMKQMLNILNVRLSYYNEQKAMSLIVRILDIDVYLNAYHFKQCSQHLRVIDDGENTDLICSCENSSISSSSTSSSRRSSTSTIVSSLENWENNTDKEPITNKETSNKPFLTLTPTNKLMENLTITTAMDESNDEEKQETIEDSSRRTNKKRKERIEEEYDNIDENVPMEGEVDMNVLSSFLKKNQESETLKRLLNELNIDEEE